MSKIKSKVVLLSERCHDGMLWCPKDMFNDAAKRSIEEYPDRKKAMAIFYDPTAKHVGFSQCGMTDTEMIRMLSRLHDELMFDLIEANIG